MPGRIPHIGLSNPCSMRATPTAQPSCSADMSLSSFHFQFIPLVIPALAYLDFLEKVFTAQSCPTLVTPWTVACQAPLSMGFSKQDY